MEPQGIEGRQMKHYALYHRLVIWKIFKIVILTGWGGFVASTAASPMAKTEQYATTLIIGTIVTLVISNLDSFFDDAAGRWVMGLPPLKLPGGNGNGNG